MHWCADETQALMTFLGSLPLVRLWFKNRFRKKPCMHEHDK